jgi:hypothetical protein
LHQEVAVGVDLGVESGTHVQALRPEPKGPEASNLVYFA